MAEYNAVELTDCAAANNKNVKITKSLTRWKILFYGLVNYLWTAI